MTKIESDKVSVNNSAESTFAFLGDFNNFQKLMPDQISNWESTAEECSFTIKGMANIGMRIAERIPSKEIKIQSTAKSPFRFQLNCLLESTEKGCIVYFVFESDLNPMIQMMVEKPLRNLFNSIVNKLKLIY